ncbi:MAG: sulfite exporter TauE/SafE family protein [Clostridia bacterium]
MSFFINALIGFGAGILTAFGIGGGTLLILCITTFASVPQLTAQGINLLYFLPTSAAALIGHAKNKFVDGRAFLFTIGGGLAAAVPAAILAGSIDVSLTRRVFGAFLLIVGLSELFRKSKC